MFCVMVLPTNSKQYYAAVQLYKYKDRIVASKSITGTGNTLSDKRLLYYSMKTVQTIKNLKHNTKHWGHARNEAA